MLRMPDKSQGFLGTKSSTITFETGFSIGEYSMHAVNSADLRNKILIELSSIHQNVFAKSDNNP